MNALTACNASDDYFADVVKRHYLASTPTICVHAILFSRKTPRKEKSVASDRPTWSTLDYPDAIIARSFLRARHPAAVRPPLLLLLSATDDGRGTSNLWRETTCRIIYRPWAGVGERASKGETIPLSITPSVRRSSSRDDTGPSKPKANLRDNQTVAIYIEQCISQKTKKKQKHH